MLYSDKYYYIYKEEISPEKTSRSSLRSQRRLSDNVSYSAFSFPTSMCPQPVFRLFFNYFLRKTVVQLRDFIRLIIARIFNQSGEFTKIMSTFFFTPNMAIDDRIIRQSGNTFCTGIY